MVLGATACAPVASTPTPALISTIDNAAGLGTPTLVVGITPQGACVDAATFVADLTLPDGTQVKPGQTVAKQWSVRNTGTCDWGTGYRLVPILPNPLATGQEVALFPARAGTQAIWEVDLVIPNTPGEVIGRWEAQNPSGQAFGEDVYVVLEVASPTSFPSPETSPTP